MGKSLRVLALLTVTAVLLGLTAVPSYAANRVRVSASDSKPFVGERVKLTARVTPGRAGRMVVFQERVGSRWKQLATDRTNRNGVASVKARFGRAGHVTVRALAKKHDGKAQTTDTLRLTVRKAPTQVTATFPVGPWTVGEEVGVPVRIGPAAAGRRVWLERLESGSWVRIADPVATSAQGIAVPRWTPTRVSTGTYRARVAASTTHHDGSSGAVVREITEAGSGLLLLEAPEIVETGDEFDIHFDIATAEQPVSNAVLAVRAPATGEQVTPPDELDVDPITRTAELALGDLPADTTRRVTLRWAAPATPGLLQVEGSLTAAEIESEQVVGSIEVVAGSSGFVFGGGLQSTHESRDAPGHADQIFAFCFGSGPPSSAAVPSFAVALAEAKEYLAQAIVGDAQAWEEVAAQDNPEVFDDVAAMALSDLRYDAVLAASLRAYELDPADGLWLSNAAAAANLLERPEWAIAFATEAAGQGGVSVGVRQEAARLVNLGHAWALKLDYAKAIAALEQARQIDSASQVVRAELGAVLACAGDKNAALPHIRRSLRTDDTGDPIEDVSGEPNTRRTRIDTSTLYDLSGGVDQTLTLPYVPASWSELAGRSRFYDGNSYYNREYEDGKQRTLDLILRAAALEQQLSEKRQSWSPARAKLTDDILRRIGTAYDRELIDARAAYLEVAEGVIRPNDCNGMFAAHPYCGDQSDNSCSLSQSLFNEWERGIEAQSEALTEFHDVAARHFSGLQALLSDPVAHELAGIRAELEFRTEIDSMVANMWQTADSLAIYNEEYDDRGPDDPPCTDVSTPALDPPVDSERAPAGLCAPGSIVSELNLTLDLGPVTVAINCENWSVEAAREVAFLEAFAKVTGNLGNNGVTVNVGVRAGVGGASFESGLYYEQDAQGKTVDYGWEGGPSLEAGNVISVTAFEDKVRISLMSLFTSP